MAKKSRRARQKAGRRPQAPSVPPPGPTVAATRQASRQQSVAESERTSIQQARSDWAEQYFYVRQDLRRIALLAGSIFTVLIILSFVLK